MSEGGTRRAQPTQRRLERQVEKSHPENFVMMLDVKREEGRGLNNRRGVDHHREGTPPHWGVITTISSGGASVSRIDGSQNRKACNVLVMWGKADITPTLVITFSERDMRYEPPRHDKPMVISVVTAEYKVESVLIDQGSSTNILYWLTCKRLGLQPADLEACTGKLYGFANEQVTIKGVIELETTFGESTHACTIPMLYMVVDVDVSYSIIMERLTLNRLGAVVSTLHLCMKYPVGQEVTRQYYEDNLRIGSQTSQSREPDVNVLDLDLDPRCKDEHERPQLAKDLKEVSIGPKPEDESHLISFLRENRDVFAWSLIDMLGINLDFLCHLLLISLGSRPIT
ncbi:hypothetical protein CR513_34906, partial [Mucuna pruriens]